MKKHSLLFAVLAVALVNQASALTTQNYATFAAATGGQPLVHEGYGSLADETLITSGSVVNGIKYDFNTSLGTAGKVDVYSPRAFLTSNGNGTMFQPGPLYSQGDTITFSFAAPINYFGVVVQISPTANFRLHANDATNSWAFGTGGVRFDYNYDTAFLGLTSLTGFDSVTLYGGNGNLAWGQGASGWRLDEVIYGSVAAPVPEPETYAMMLAGLGLMGLMTRRRKQKQSAAT